MLWIYIVDHVRLGQSHQGSAIGLMRIECQHQPVEIQKDRLTPCLRSREKKGMKERTGHGGHLIHLTGDRLYRLSKRMECTRWMVDETSTHKANRCDLPTLLIWESFAHRSLIARGHLEDRAIAVTWVGNSGWTFYKPTEIFQLGNGV